MPKLPYFQFYPDDYLSSPGVTTCDLKDEGVYLRLLCYSWKHDGCQLPDNLPYLKRLCKGVRETRLRRVLDQFFVRIEVEKNEFYWRNLRLFTEFCKVHGVSLKRSDAAKVRWDKEKQNAIAVNVHMQVDMQNDAIPDTRHHIPEPEKKDIGRRKKREPFRPPTIEEITAYCQERKNAVDPQAFLGHYVNTGWRIGRYPGYPMRDWKAAIRNTWEKNNYGGGNGLQVGGGRGRYESAIERKERKQREDRAEVGRALGICPRGIGVPHVVHPGESDSGGSEKVGSETIDGTCVEIKKT